MRYGLLPSDYLIDRIRRDCRLPDYNLNPDDLRDWIAEAVRALSAKGQFAERTERIAYKNHVAALPTDWAGYKCGCNGFTRHYNSLRFTQASGIADITYYVLPVDDTGMPMLVDEPNTLEYFFWYVAEKLCYLGDLPRGFTTQDCMVKKLDYKKVAETTLNWPTTSRSRHFSNPR
jgi:hypothetical protein